MLLLKGQSEANEQYQRHGFAEAEKLNNCHIYVWEYHV